MLSQVRENYLFCCKMFPSHSSVTECQRSRCSGGRQGSVSQSDKQEDLLPPPITSCQPLPSPGHLLASLKQYLVKLLAEHVQAKTGACAVTTKQWADQARQYVLMLTVLCGDDYQLIVMDHGLAETTLARQRQFSTRDTDRPKYSDLDPIGHHPRSISKFGLFVLSPFYLQSDRWKISIWLESVVMDLTGSAICQEFFI